MAREASQTKELIDDTALRLFVEKGVTATTTKSIARTAGISEATLYLHYASKNNLAWELFAKNYVELAVNLDRCQQQHQNLKDKLAAIIRKMTPDMPNPVRVLKSAIAGGMGGGEIPQADADLKTAMVLGLIIQVAVFKIYGIISRSLSNLAPTLVDNSWKILST
jgi:AcrR family transcriptional regulator